MKHLMWGVSLDGHQFDFKLIHFSNKYSLFFDIIKLHHFSCPSKLLQYTPPYSLSNLYPLFSLLLQYVLYMHIYIITKYHLLVLYNIAHRYDFRVDHLVTLLHNQWACSSLGKTPSLPQHFIHACSSLSETSRTEAL